MKINKGVTLISLAIMIVVLLILATVGISYSKNTEGTSRLTKYTTEMEIIQTKIDVLRSEEENIEEITNFGLTDLQLIAKCNDLITKEDEQTFTEENLREKLKYFKYYTAKQISQELGVEGIDKDYLIDIKDNIVLSIDPLLYKGKKYYSINGLEKDGIAATKYRPEYIEE